MGATEQSESLPVKPTVLVVDDEVNIRRTLNLVLSGVGYRVLEAERGEQALDLLYLGQEPIDLVILDLKLDGMGGLAALEKMRAEESTKEIPVIVISGHATVHDAVSALKLGASDFFEKPLNRERTLVSVQNCLKNAFLSRTVQRMQAELEQRYEMIGTSPAMQRLYSDIDKVSPTKAGVLVTGESGTGKELVCRAIHRLSPRKDGPFIKVNCAAIPRELIESELFGHERGAFTGAQQRKRGFFEQAHGGTLLLDEIGDMALVAQAKVLRALQSGEITRVGSEHVANVDVRVLAATNKDLGKAVQDGQFREDLFFRLNVFPLRTPALRERMEDIDLLAQSFIAAFCRENGLRKKALAPSALVELRRRKWVGNVRELKNAVERAAILSEDEITVADLPEDPHTNPFDDEPERVSIIPEIPSGERPTLRQFRDQTERRYIVETLSSVDWNISKAAETLGIERTNLHKKVRAYGIKRGET
ncbi:MAG TPA: sigma-54 dependent transcriptional regulator [Polyangiaceae bacterium]|nr:sigma-54 dependent transcriptional regulator [Polyangiaceae bacterium]